MAKRTYPRATCSGCTWTSTSSFIDERLGVILFARLHDGVNHRVTIWESATSQMDRSTWAEK